MDISVRPSKRANVFSQVIWVTGVVLLCQLTVVGSGAATATPKQKATTKAAKTTTTTESPTTTTEYPTTTIDYYGYLDEEYEDDIPVDPDKTAYAVLICVSGAGCILLLYMGLFGRRMRRTAIRWHVINCSWWSILHLVSYGAFAEKAPWPEFIVSEDWRESSKEVECFTRSIFPFGMLMVYVEAMILIRKPHMGDNWIFNTIFFFLLIPYLNAIALFCFFAKWMETTWFYPPIEFLNILTYVLFILITFAYLIACIVGSGHCCFIIFSRRNHKRSIFTFVDMWLLLPYGLIPAIMYGPSFGFTSLRFIMEFLYQWIIDSGILDGAGEGGKFMAVMERVIEAAITALPWFVLLVPLTQVTLAVICIPMFREQFFFVFSCGRFYEEPATLGTKESKRWASPAESRDDYPPVELVKMEEA